MRKLAIALVVFLGFGALVGVGAVMGVLSGLGGRSGQSWAQCSTGPGVWGGNEQRGKRAAGALGPEQRRIVRRIIEIGKQRGLPPRAWQIAIQAGKTESNLRNVHYGHADSQGVFQMRPSQGWGSVAQVTNVDYAINKFYDVLLTVEGWQDMRPGEAAQAVERSAFPSRYHDAEAMAAHLVSTEGSVSGTSGCESLPSTTLLAGQAIEYAKNQLGKPYVWGAEGPHTFDCSGLTQRAWAAADVQIPRVSQDQYDRGGKHVPLSRAQPGDLVFWGYGRNPDAIHHVAMYLGDDMVLHAPQPGETVERAKLWDGGELMPTVVRPVPDSSARAAAHEADRGSAVGAPAGLSAADPAGENVPAPAASGAP
ncbi:NlpC/P60 family protein [Halopolyspora algeriensis]|uniref:NlpC/P60 family protein n=1 Tax=Halopolyspora algeriensis TaxID=1500506 RepID=A0A368VH61_9ACTN|nr:C40 family peptidase [Halopolyspora algeriensis]RCW40691.1 NlpC/P60 family protein [Halopolyspora algeriensis]TQM53386.1 NlpC/P60 family protein [Halopolyspora algeriensis]